MKKFVVLRFVVSFLVIASGVSIFIAKQNTDTLSQYTAVVSHVVDGDTIVLANGDKVRYIGADTPETKHPYKSVQYFGKKAFEFNEKLVKGKKVRLEFDVQKRDKYDRLLAYVWVDQTLVNAQLLKHGYAKCMNILPNVKYLEYFAFLEFKSKKDRVGLWANQENVRK